MSKYIYYEVDGKRAQVPSENQQKFEERYPDAKIYYNYHGRDAVVPIKSRDAFIEKYGEDNLSFSTFDDFDALKKKADIQEPKKEKTDDGKTHWWESLIKPIGAGVVRFAQGGVDAFQALAPKLEEMAISRIQPYGVKSVLTENPLPSYDEQIADPNNPLTRASNQLGEVAERLSNEGDPAPDKGFVDLLAEGEIGLMLQKGLATAGESAVQTLSSRNPVFATLNLISNAGRNYADYTKEDPNIPAAKRGVMAVGAAAWEQIVEKFADPVFDYIHGGKGVAKEITEEMATEAMAKGFKEATGNIATRILRKIGKVGKNTAKSALGEGAEEIVSSAGTDLLGQALDWLDGNKDYGLAAQWNEYKEANPDATKEDFAWSKAKEYTDAFIGGALSGGYMSGTTQAIVEPINAATDRKAKKKLEESYTLGASMGYGNIYDSDDLVRESNRRVAESFVNEAGEQTISNEFIESLSSDEAFILSRDNRFSGRQRAELESLANAKAVQEGLSNKLDNALREQIAFAQGIVENASEGGENVTIGMVNGRSVYVVGGVVKNERVNIDESGLNGPIVVIDAETGKKDFVNSNEISSAYVQNAETHKEDINTFFTDSEAKNREVARNTMGPIAKLKAVQQFKGQKMQIDLGNGIIEVEVQDILTQSGEVQIKGKKGDLGGQTIIRIGASEFYDSISRDDNGQPQFVDGPIEEEPEVETHQEPTNEPIEEPIAPTTGKEDFRDFVGQIVINGVPTNVEVISQDGPSDSIVYEYIDENGNTKSGRTTIGGFAEAVRQAGSQPTVETPVDEPIAEPTEEPTPAPETEVPQEPIAPQEPAPLEPESINWDELFERDPWAYFEELKKQFGDGAIDFINNEIAATEEEIAYLEKHKGNSRSERVANLQKKSKLQLQLGTLYEMLNKLNPTPQTPTEAPVGQAPTAPTEPTAPTTPQEPIEPTAPQEPTIPQEPVVPTEPVAPTTQEPVEAPTQEPAPEPTIEPEPQPAPAPQPTPAPKPKPSSKPKRIGQVEQLRGNAIKRMFEDFKAKAEKIAKKIGMKDFVDTDENRPAMTGVYREGGYEYASDSHILAKIKASYPAEQEGKIFSIKTGQEISGRYPKADVVIDSHRKDAKAVPVDIDDLLAYTQTLEEIKKGTTAYKLFIKIGDKTFDTAKLIKAVKMAKQQGLTEIYAREGNNAPLVFVGENGVVLAMPMTKTKEGDTLDLSTGEITFRDYTSPKVPTTLRGIEATRVALESMIPNYGEDWINVLKGGGRIRLEDGKVFYSFDKNDISAAKNKANDPNTYNALEAIEKNGLEIPLSDEEIAKIFPENFVPSDPEPNGGNNGPKGETPQGENTQGHSNDPTSGRGNNAGNQGASQGGSHAASGSGSEGQGGETAQSVANRYPARKGNATGKLLIDTFGFREVTIPDSRKSILNSIYDFMMGMAKVLGISPNTIGNGGILAVGNLRGNSSANARYQHKYTFTEKIYDAHIDFRYDNLMSIAHEWWHALDHALHFFDSGYGTEKTTAVSKSKFGGREETYEAVQAVLQAIKDSDHNARVKTLGYGRKYTNYLLTPTELVARAFDEYIKDKFEEAGIEIGGLTYEEAVRKPNAEEMKVIAPAIENLFKVLKEKEGKIPGTSVLYQIGEEVDEKLEGVSEEAYNLTTEAIALALDENASVNRHEATDEQAEQMMDASGASAEFMLAPDRPVFVSNAAIAVAGINQEKATPEQWLKMIEKNGGLKAGEDKWIGLSDWLKASDKKTLTKQEVLDYIKDNQIQIEEVNYAELDYFAEDKKLISAINDEFLALRHEAEEAGEWIHDAGDIAYQQMVDKYGDDFSIAFGVDLGELYVSNREAASAVTGVDLGTERAIDETRIGYTTEGLNNYKEIALVVPTIESWNERDEIHFGDAGEGRAVAWVRFGETEVTVQDETQQRLNEIYDRLSELEMKVSSSTGITMEEYEERARLREERDRLQEIEPKTQRVLVIDEIQSKRHQEGREMGYKTSREKADAEMDKFMKQMHDKYEFSSSTPFADVFNEEEMRELARLNMQQHRATFGTSAIPDAPFDKNWHELAMKRMLRYAAENGYDIVAWTTGAQQTQRYNLGGYVSSIEMMEEHDGFVDFAFYIGDSDESCTIGVEKETGIVRLAEEPLSAAEERPLSDLVGKELAVKMMQMDESDVLEDADLQIGGEGMKGFYDKMLPAFMNKYGKRWGIKVSDITLPLVEKAGQVMHSVPVTQEMKDSVLEGQPMFMKRPNGKVYGWAIGNDIYHTKDGFNPNTLVHEYTHLWARAMMQKNPKGWQSVKDNFRGTPVWNEVLNDPRYSDIHNNEDLVASEVLSRLSGREGAAKLQRMTQQMLDEAKGTARKLEARGIIQNIKDALNQFWNWVGTELFGIEKFDSIEQITDRVLWDLMNKTDLGSLSEGQVETQIVTDPKVIAELEASPKRTGFRNVVQNEDGTFSSPMAYWLQSSKGGAKTRVETAKFELGKWEEAEEHSDLVDENGHITLVKPNKGTIDVAYDPYIHNRLDPVNLQFKDAWKRDELVYVETEVPETDLESGYHADKALLPVGVHSWSNGDLMLSKYDKPVRVMPWEDVADAWVARLNGDGVHFDVVPPALRSLLVERGVEILPPHKGMGKDCNDAYAEWKEKQETDGLLFRRDYIQVAPSIYGRIATVLSSRFGNKNEYNCFVEIDGIGYICDYIEGETFVRQVIENNDHEQTERNKRIAEGGYGLDESSSSALFDELGDRVSREIWDSTGSRHEGETLENDSLGSREHGEKTEQRGGYKLPFGADWASIKTGKDGTREPRVVFVNQSDIDKLTRRSDVQNAAVNFLVGKPRLRAIENAVNEEAAKLGVTVTYKTREEMPKGHKNDKGYYNTKTGEIVICTENASSINDAIQTILHEAVAHKGLRKLMGDKFNEFINRVYDSLDAETKAKVDVLAAEKYNGNTAVAMEEYMASLAETTDFADNSVWSKIKSIFEDIINAILGRNDIKIGDNELRYILRASYNNMVNPRNMETVRGWAQDQMMREEYNINHATPELLSRTGVDPTEVATMTAAEVYNRAVKASWQEFQRQFQDAMQPVRIAIDAIQQETGNIPIEDYENYILWQNQISSRSRVEIDNFQRSYYKPIIEAVNKIIDNIVESRGYEKDDESMRSRAYHEVVQYLIAEHGLERNAYYQSTRTKKVDGEEVPDLRDYSGLTTLFGMDPNDYEAAEEAARTYVENFEAFIDTTGLWDRINRATDKTLRHSYESGLLSRSQYEQIKGMFQFYIPLRGFDETTAEDVYSYARFEGNRFNPTVYKAGGRTSLADDPIAIIMNMAESEIAQGNKNRAKQALYNYILNRPVTDSEGNQTQNSLMQIESVWYIQNVDEHGYVTYTLATPDRDAGETYEEFEERMKALAEEDGAVEDTKMAYKSKKGKVDVGMRFQKSTNANAHYIYLKVNGVEKAIYVNGDPKAADAINGANKQPMSELAQKAREVNRLISSTFTNYSLEFTTRNYFRDMIYSHINIGVKESDPEYRKRFRQNWRHNNLRSMVNMLTAYRNGDFEGRPLTADESAFVEFMESGGQTGYTLINSVENHKKDLEKAIKRMRDGVNKGGVKDSTAFKYTLGAVELLNESAELVTRFAAFKTSRDMGRSVLESVNDAKEVTVNFNTKGAQDGKGWMGTISRYLGWAKYFFNASVQGVQNLKAMAEANKLKFCGVVGGVMATGLIVPIVTSVLANMFGGDEEEYWNIPEYDRQNNLCIVLGGGMYAKIPLPIGFREIYALGDMVAAMAFDQKFQRDTWQIGTDMANKIASIVLPINPLESSVNGLSIWHTIAYTLSPSSAQFIIQNLSNVDWKGAPLQKEYTYNENDPQWMKAFNSAPEWMVVTAKWINELTSADDMKGIDLSPEKFDNSLSNMFGGIYTIVKKTGKTISMIWNEENRNLSNVPLSGAILGSNIDEDDRFVQDAYYDMKDYYDERIGWIKRRAEKFGIELDNIMVNMDGGYYPKIAEIYENKNFEWMQAWYIGNKEIEKRKKAFKDFEKEMAAYDEPTEAMIEHRTQLQDEFLNARREFVDKMLEMN